MTWQDVLLWCQGPGVNSIAGVVWSFIVEAVPAFNKLSPLAKRMGFLALCMIIPLAAHVVQLSVNPALAEEWWPILYSGLVGFGAGTAAHARALVQVEE